MNSNEPESNVLNNLSTDTHGNILSPLQIFTVLFIFIVYIALRLNGLIHVEKLEDHDSISYLKQTQDFLDFAFTKLITANPDNTPFYPFFSSIFSWMGGSIELGTRICSLFFSAVLFIPVVYICNLLRLEFITLFACLLFLTLSPVLTSLSYATLTEPSYIATCYIALAFFLYQSSRPTSGTAILSGFLFGLCFLNRTEGFIFIAVIPFLQLIHFFLGKANYSKGQLLRWILIYTLVFSVTILPQIVRVSSVLDQPALNGRQVWTVLLKSDVGESYAEIIYGLKYSESQVNLKYAFSHPEATNNLNTELDINSYINTIKNNIYTFLIVRVDQLTSKPIFLFAMFGLIGLWIRGRRSEAAMFTAFIGACLVPAFIHNVVIRHIAVIAPLLLILAAIGLETLTMQLAKTLKPHQNIQKPISIFIAIFLSWSILHAKDDAINNDYDPVVAKAIANIIKKDADILSFDSPTIASRKSYIPYYAGGKRILLPYTDLKGLSEYLRLNEANYILVDEKLLKNFPWQKELKQSDEFVGWKLIYTEKNYVRTGRTLHVYRKNSMSNIGTRN